MLITGISYVSQFRSIFSSSARKMGWNGKINESLKNHREKEKRSAKKSYENENQAKGEDNFKSYFVYLFSLLWFLCLKITSLQDKKKEDK